MLYHTNKEIILVKEVAPIAWYEPAATVPPEESVRWGVKPFYFRPPDEPELFPEFESQEQWRASVAFSDEERQRVQALLALELGAQLTSPNPQDVAVAARKIARVLAIANRSNVQGDGDVGRLLMRDELGEFGAEDAKSVAETGPAPNRWAGLTHWLAALLQADHPVLSR